MTRHILRTHAVIYRAENRHQFCPGGCCGDDEKCKLSYFGQAVITRADRCTQFKSREKSAMDRRKNRHKRDARPSDKNQRPFYQALGDHPDEDDFIWNPVMRVMVPPPDKNGNRMDVRHPATVAEALFIYYFNTLERSHGYNHDWPPRKRRVIDPRQPRITAQLDKTMACHFHLRVAMPPHIMKLLAEDLGPGFRFCPR